MDKSKSVTIALLTPYSGANLGDGAIHDAIIANFRNASANVRLISVVANPEEICRLHGIEATTSSALAGPFRVASKDTSQSSVPHPGNGSREEPAQEKRTGSRFGSALRKTWRLAIEVPVARSILLGTRTALHEIWKRRSEPRHFYNSFKFARQVDLIIVCGGGQLNDSWGGAWGHPYVLFRWALLARFSGTPFAIASVGVGRLSSILTRIFIYNALRWSSYRSYRDPESKAKLARWPFTDEDPVVPDFAYTLPVPRTSRAKPTLRDRYRVAISPIKFGAHRHSVPGQEEIYQNYINTLADLSVRLLRSEHEPAFVTSSRDDSLALTHLFELIAAKSDADHRKPEVLPSHDRAQLIESLASIDIIVASRLHSIILAQRLGHPALAFSFEHKVDAHMRLFCMDHFLLDASYLTPDLAWNRFQNLIHDLSSVSRLTVSRTAELASRTSAQYSVLLKLAGQTRNR